MKTGDPISPPGGYKGGGMQMLADVSIDPAGNVWVSDNWQDPTSCYGEPDEGVSTRCGGPVNDGVLRHSKAGAFATDRPGPTTVAETSQSVRKAPVHVYRCTSEECSG